jgi:hypothetical protein
MSRFDYVQLDLESIQKTAKAKLAALDMEAVINTLPNGREKLIAMTKIEECFCWVEKSIRNEQTLKTPKAIIGMDDVPELEIEEPTEAGI